MRPAPTDINLADIAYQFGRGRAQRAKRMIRQEESALRRILGAKDTSGNRDNLRARADVDALIDYYGIVTLAAMSGVLELPLPFSFRSEAIAELRQRDIWTYIVSQGTDLLPRLLTYEIENNSGFFRIICKDPLQFACFLDMISVWSESKGRIAHFLHLFDSSSNREGDAELLRLFTDTKVGGTLNKASVKTHFAELDGFSELLVFSYAYDELLRHLNEVPVFQSAIWHYIAPRFTTSSRRIMEFAEALAQSVPGYSSDAAFEAMLRIVDIRGTYYRPLYEFIYSTQTLVGSEQMRETPNLLPSRRELTTEETKERLDLNEVIQEVVVFASAEVQRSRVEVRTELALDLPPVLGDRVQLKQVILTLIMAGIEAMSTVVPLQTPQPIGDLRAAQKHLLLRHSQSPISDPYNLQRTRCPLS